ncbi:LPS export ABC transporter periplasmic protein LptC [Bacteroides sedimenti]|uniref:LPS export ABC transporter periplasmic protein LptC n=2 Tax=Bacteroides sedimenti TaxID=2136147 RepID=A0ABM8IDR2_9BACE
MKSLDVTTLISDSGITRYRIKTKEWMIFDKKEPSYWSFEKGLYLEKFDTTYHVEASIKADTAYYYDKKKLWELRGHVLIKNLQGDRFSTEQLFWDQMQNKVYSSKYISIKKSGRTINGYGFESNQEMTVYKIHKTSGALPIDDRKIAPPDTTKH